MAPNSSIILASSSRYRQAQFSALGLSPQAIAPNIDESALPRESGQTKAERLSRQKARAVSQRYPDATVIGCDQVASVTTNKGEVQLGKPGNLENAVAQLTLCSGNSVNFYSAMTLCRQNSGQCITECDVTTVHFRDLSQAHILNYLKKEQPFDCAGSFKAEKRGTLLFRAIDSRDPNSLIGLPVMLLQDMLASFDIDLLALATSSVE